MCFLQLCFVVCHCFLCFVVFLEIDCVLLCFTVLLICACHQRSVSAHAQFVWGGPCYSCNATMDGLAVQPCVLDNCTKRYIGCAYILARNKAAFI